MIVEDMTGTMTSSAAVMSCNPQNERPLNIARTPTDPDIFPSSAMAHAD